MKTAMSSSSLATPVFTYEKLAKAIRYLQRGAALVATNADICHPGSGGWKVPETGALLAPLELISGAKARVVGKPERFLFEKCLAAFGFAPGRTAMVGDNPLTDVAGANKAGMKSILVHSLTGEKPASAIPWKEYGTMQDFLREFA